MYEYTNVRILHHEPCEFALLLLDTCFTLICQRERARTPSEIEPMPLARESLYEWTDECTNVQMYECTNLYTMSHANLLYTYTPATTLKNTQQKRTHAKTHVRF